MQRDLSGRVAVVTGASRGLGREIALALANEGAEVVAAARDPGDLEETARFIERETRRSVVTVQTDVSRPEDVASLKAETEARLGRAAILINAAAVFGPLAPFSVTDPSKWIETLMINAVGSYLTCRAFVPGMIDAGWGRIINVSSAASLYPPGPFDSAYATSKAALNHMTRHLASELEGKDITANVIHPGSFKTDMWKDISSQLAVLGEQADALGIWAERIGRTGGDPMSKAIDLIFELLDTRSGQINGQFCWPHDALDEPVASW